MKVNTDELANCAVEQSTLEIENGESYPRICPHCGNVVEGEPLPVHIRRYCSGVSNEV